MAIDLRGVLFDGRDIGDRPAKMIFVTDAGRWNSWVFFWNGADWFPIVSMPADAVRIQLFRLALATGGLLATVEDHGQESESFPAYIERLRADIVDAIRGAYLTELLQ